MKKSAIIVAGGMGSRMNSAIPKQFLLLNGRPLLMHTISGFIRHDPRIFLVLVLPEDQISRWNELCSEYDFNQNYAVAGGGPTRFHSVRNGLKIVPEEGIVAVHDGARPLISPSLIGRLYEEAAQHGSAVPCTLPSESIRMLYTDGNKAVDRSSCRMIQTPQCFESALLKEAYGADYRESFTDDASVVENKGFGIHLTEGDPRNIKITTALDLQIAEILMSGKS